MTATHQWPPAHELADAVRHGEHTACELLDEALAAVERLNPALNAWVEMDADGARRAAEAVDAAVARGVDPGPFAGVPIGVKDQEALAGVPSREGSELLRDAPPAARDSVHVARLRAAGAVPIGKTTVPEFGMTSQTTTRAFGVTRNPWNVAATPGGSSGGSAAAVSAGMVPLATAGDGGGSTRIPAAWCGLVGLKPSHGRIPQGWPNELSVLGALSVSVVDAARHLDVAAGPDSSDHHSLPAPTVRYADAIDTLDLSGLRAAWSPDLGWAAVDDEVAALAEETARQVAASAGLAMVDRPVRVPNAMAALLLTMADMFHKRLAHAGLWPAAAERLDDVTRQALEMRVRLGPEHLFRADERRRQVIATMAEIFRDVDVLFTPTTAMAAPPAVGPPPDTVSGKDARLSGAVPFTPAVNMAWNPAIAVPAGITRAGMPASLQIIGPRHRDEVVLRLARLVELERPWQRRPTTITAPAGDLPQAGATPAYPFPPEVLARWCAWSIDLAHDGTQPTPELEAEILAIMARAASTS